MEDIGEVWRKKPDEDLIIAMQEIDDYTESGRRAIRAEFERRGLVLPRPEEEVEAKPHDPGTYCPECGALVAVTIMGSALVGTCAECGIEVIEPTEQEEMPPDGVGGEGSQPEPEAPVNVRPRERFVQCPQCEAAIADDCEFCYHCGVAVGDTSLLTEVAEPGKADETPVASRPGHGKAVFGAILLVVGIILLMTRHELALALVGSERALIDTFRGGSALGSTMLGLTAGGAVCMLVGAVMLVSGMLSARSG
jgi:hypothetical protein